MRVAITGSTGMIGSELVKQYLDKGDEVIAIVNPDSKRLNNLPQSNNLEVVKADISNYNSIREEQCCDAFIHLSWMKTFGNARDDVHTQMKNIEYSLDAVDLSDSWGAKSFLGIGSQAEYGPVEEAIDGNTPINPQSGYGIAKYSSGKLCNLYCEQKGIKFNWARVLSVYGPLDNENSFIMYIIRCLLHGSSPQLTKCEQIWDYIYSEDCGAAIRAICEKGVDGKYYCIGSGKPRLLSDYAETIRNIIKPEVKICFGAKEYYPHQPMYLCANITELTEDTGFKPQYSFEEGITKTIDTIKLRTALSNL